MYMHGRTPLDMRYENTAVDGEFENGFTVVNSRLAT